MPCFRWSRDKPGTLSGPSNGPAAFTPARRDLVAAHVRDHLAPRRGQDHAHREAPALRRGHPPGRLGQGARASGAHATSDWMEIERERGISITSQRAAVRLRGRRLNLLDTPGHNDFSEDTYRTLAAADTAIMLIDSAKGVEPQTSKLFQVCRMRGDPDRHLHQQDGPRRARPVRADRRDRARCSASPCSPVTWPIGAGTAFRGVYDRWSKQLLLFERVARRRRAPRAQCEATSLDDPELVEAHRRRAGARQLARGGRAARDRRRRRSTPSASWRARSRRCSSAAP